MYTLYGYAKTRSFRVAWALEELGVDYNYQVVNLKAGEHKLPGYLKLSATGKVPLLLTDEGALAESAGLLAYLGHKHGAPLLPEKCDTETFGRISEMLLFLASELEQPLWTLAKHSFALPEDKRIPDIKATAIWEYEQALAVFSSMLGDRNFVAGDEFSYADILAAHVLNWAKGTKMPCAYDNVNLYHQRIVQRTAYTKAWKREQAELDKL